MGVRGQKSAEDVAKKPGYFEKMTGASRRSIQYYEKAGLLRTRRSGDSGHRDFTAADMHRIAQLCILRNSGRAMTDVLDLEAGGDITCEQMAAFCAEQNARDLAWRQAVGESLETLAALYRQDAIGVPRIAWFEARRFYLNQEDPLAYGEADALQAAFVQGTPVSSISAIFDSVNLTLPGAPKGRWGVSVPERFAALVESTVEGNAPTLANRVDVEGHTCVCVPFACAANEVSSTDIDGSYRQALLGFMEENDVAPAGDIYMIRPTSVGDLVYVAFAVRVVARGDAGKALLADTPALRI